MGGGVSPVVIAVLMFVLGSDRVTRSNEAHSRMLRRVVQLALKNILPILISIIALLVSVAALSTDTRGLTVVVRDANIDPTTRAYEAHISLVNTGSRDIIFFAPDVSGNKNPEDSTCPQPDADITPNLHSLPPTDFINVPAGSIASHTLRFEFQNMIEGSWVVCIDGNVSDFQSTVQDVRFKAGEFAVTQNNGQWAVEFAG